MISFRSRYVTLAALVAAYGTTTWRRHGDNLSTSAALSVFVCAFCGAWSLLVAAYALYAILLYPFLLSPLRHLPQPGGNEFVLGQFRRIAREPSGAPALDWINSIPNDGLIRYLGFFNRERLLVTQPRVLAEVLVSKNYDFCKPRIVRQALSRLLGVGILLAEGDEHRYQRRLLTPAFAFRHIKELYPVFWRKARESADVLARMARATADDTGTGALEIGGLASRATLDIIGLAGLGRDFGALQNPDNELAATYRMVLQPSRAAQWLGLLDLVLPRWLVTALPIKRNAQIAAASRFLRQTCTDLVREKRAKLTQRRQDEKEGKEGKESKDDAPPAAAADLDILSVALESGGFTDANLADQLMTFLAAGHETTSAALTWAIYCLSVHPDVQARLRAEVRENLPSLAAGPDASSVDIDHLPYLHAVCSEVLRYFSPVPLTLREAAVDTTLAGQFVPRGTTIMLVPWAVNKSEALWGPDAGRFDPERWLHTREDGGASGASGAPGTARPSAPSNYAFMTFLHGPRSCIGMAFARAEFACLLAAWVGSFAFRLRDAADLDEAHLKIKGGVSARPAGGMNVCVTPLEGW